MAKEYQLNIFSCQPISHHNILASGASIEIVQVKMRKFQIDNT